MAQNYSASGSELATQYKDASNLAARQQIYQFAVDRNPNWYRWVFDQLQEALRSRNDRDAVAVLELGCGNGKLWQANADRIPRGWRVRLSDASPGMIAEARAALAQLPGRQLRQFQWMQIDARQIPLADASGDAVIANHMLYHVMPRRQGLAEIRRILEPGGMLFASTNSGNHLRALKDLIDQFVPEAPDAVGDSDADGTFWLEDGPPQLARFFAEVRVATQNGELRVTDPQAIVEYVLSIERAKSIVVGDSLQRLREAIDAHLRANNGAFVIGTHVGILTARRGA